MESWQSIASFAQNSVSSAIPERWRLPAESRTPSSVDVRSVPETCGLLTPKQLVITEHTATELLGKLHAGAWSSAEVVEAFCGRTAIAHQLLNCLTAFFPEEALAQAKELDAILARTGKPIGPLHGLPVPIKDVYNMAGKVTTNGYIAWVGNVASKDSSMVTILRDAGAVFYARTTMPQTGMLLETWSPLWGRTLNPYNTAFGSGGSSGGDAVLVAMKGAPISPSADIGGSIRAPAAFNGLYAIRPSAERVPRTGMTAAAPGNTSIKISCGPEARCMADVKMFTQLILTHPTLPFEPTCVPLPWRELPTPTTGKLCLGMWMTDGVVDPHPPIRRALLETAAKLRAEGHEVFEFRPPFDLWEAARCTWRLYFQTGAVESKALIKAAGEPLSEVFQLYLKRFNIEPLTVSALFKLNTEQADYKLEFSDAWTKTASTSSTGRPMDALICPAGPSAGIPHDFPVWWGYFSIFNLLDYPSIILPIKDIKIDLEKDAKDLSYTPRENPFDEENWRICEFWWPL